MAKRPLFISMAAACVLLGSALSTVAAAQTFLTSWGSFGSGDNQFRTPVGVAVGGSGDVYVIDGDNHRVQVFTSTGSFLRQWPVPLGSVNIAVDVNDNVYVSAEQMYKFTSTGTLVTAWGGPGVPGVPNSLAVDAAGNLYAGDKRNQRVLVFTGAGEYIREWGGPGSGDGQFNYPDGLAVDAAGNVYVADKGNRRIQKFTSIGTYLTQWGGPGADDGEFGLPVRVAVDQYGHVFVVDNSNSRVEEFTSDGNFVTKWGSAGSGNGQFDNPIGIAVDGQGDIYVADTNNSRIQKFGFPPTPLQSLTWGGMKSRYRGERGAVQPEPQGR